MLTSVRGVAAVGVAVGVIALKAQTPKPAFEVASVKPQGTSISFRALENAMPRIRPGGVFNPTHTTVQALLMFAYDLREYRIVSGPEWVRRDLFQIDARAGNDAPAEQIKLMVQSLLDDRFKLVTHREQREMRFQALVRARSDGRLGSSLVSMDECNAQIVNELRKKFPEKYPTPTGGMMSGCSTVTVLADILSIRLRMPVIDETGLNGSFYYIISPGDPSIDSIPPALEEQLGLKLASRRGPLDVLVIDSVQQPTEN